MAQLRMRSSIGNKAGFNATPFVVVVLAMHCLLLATPAHAYLGPGAGLGMIGSLIALFVVLLVIIFGLVVYPIRRLRKHRTKAAQSSERIES